MTSTTKLLLGSLAAAISLGVTTASAQTTSSAAIWMMATTGPGQTGQHAPDLRQAQDMLKQAQRAMHEGNFSLAESLINRADQMGAGRASLLAPNFAYTPDKARAELAKLQAERGGSRLPSASASPALLNRNSGPSLARSMPATRGNPIDRIGASQKQTAQRYLDQGRAALQQGNHLAAQDYYRKATAVGANFGPGEYSPQNLASDLKARGVDVGRLAGSRGSTFDVAPPTAERGGVADRIPSYAPLRAPGGESGNSRMIENTTPDRRSSGLNPEKKEAEGKLLQARRALARGKASEAAEIAEQVRSMGVRFELRDDSPDRIDSLVRRFHQLARTPETGRADERFTRQYSQLLLEQAEWLMRYGDTEPARHLAKRAESLGARYAPQERSPSQLLAEINGTSRPSGPAVPNRNPISPNKKKALSLMAQAQAYLDRGDTYNARRLVDQVQNLGVASSEFGPDEPNPDWLAMQIKKASKPRTGVSHAVYDSAGDRTRTQMAQFTLPPDAANATATELFEAGEKAYKDRDLAAAEGFYKAAWKKENQLDPHVRQMLQERLQSIQIAIGGVGSQGGTVLEEVETEQQVYRRKIFAEVSRAKSLAQQQRESDPAEALRQLEGLRNRVNQSQLSAADRQQLLSSIDFAAESTHQYIEENRYRILAEQETADAKDRIERRHEMRAEINSKLNDMVDEFNELMDQQRWDEAEVLARQAKELDPDSELTTALNWKAKFVKRYQAQLAMRAQYDDGFWGAMQSVDESAIPFDDRDPYVHGDIREWSEISENRLRRMRDQSLRISPGEAKIRAALSQLVDVRFEERPLSEVLHTLGTAVGINIYLDEQGLAAEGRTSDTPVTINLTQEPISLKSALNLILQQHRLSYVIRDEVLVVTSEQMKDTDVRTTVYDVADLVIPIPNFVPSYNIGLPGAIKAAHNALGYGALGTNMGNTAVPLVAQNGPSGGMPGSSALANLMANNGAGLGSLSGSRAPQPIGYGPGGLGGGAQADFDTLIELITSTIAPTTWTDVGGPGSVEGFDTNLSLVVSQTQEVHDDIVDLLEQLRRLQDLQVTIEVRFVTLRDDFFERIGVDFDFDIDDNSNIQNVAALPDDTGPSITIGLQPGTTTPTPTVDFDLQYTQNSFGATLPAFGGFDPATAANFGFAILSDIEAFFVIQAAQGDNRTNVMQAPKVTLFNGQQAFVSDTSQRPFVTSIVPIVGDFAAAQQPVIVVLSEGTSLSVQAVVSPDRRFVRLTLVPFFSRIGEVEEFTFTGRTTSNSGTNAVDPDDPEADQTPVETVTEGTTVQLPTFSFVTVTTTVSVPDGGTVLLGGIKRLSEGRTERGVPVLSKVPYVNRLFKNVGIGRTSQSLMMMVTPRIIIQEEEEERLGLPPPP